MTLDQAMQLWVHYEQVAMHFNELIIQYRLQLMGGAGAIGAISGYLIGTKVESEDARIRLRAFVTTGILILLFAAMYLDLFYYNELLRGAVKAVIEHESKFPELFMSSMIKEQFPCGATKHIIITYALVLVPLLVYTIWTWFQFWKK